MHILIITLNYSPELTGIGKYSGEMAEWLVSRGHHISVVTAPPYYPQWKVANAYHAWKYKNEVLNGVKISRCPLWVPAKTTGVKRIIHLASFALSSFPIMLFQIFKRPDIIIAVEPPLFCAPTSLLVSFLCRSRSWLHIQDFEVDAAFDLGILSSPRLKCFVLKIESWLMSKFSRVSTISTQMIKRLDGKGVRPEKKILFPNWVDIECIYPTESASDFRDKLGISISSVVFLYSGNMGEKQGLEIIIEAARKLVQYENIVFVMCGQGGAYDRLYHIAKGLENICWLPLQPLEKLNDLLNMADVHLLPQRLNASDLVMPSKLTGMLASGRPVLATVLEETQIAEVLETTGVIVPPESCGQFVSAIINLADNPEQRQVLGKSARQYAVNYLSQNAILKQFEKELYDCISPE